MKFCNIKKFLKAFSLVELMVSLVVISIIASAFVPVVTKKLSKNEITISASNSNVASDFELSTECSNFSSSCKLCSQNYCVQCDIDECEDEKFVDSKTCQCKKCSELYSNCLTCDKSKCIKCESGYYVKNGICQVCKEGKICDGTNIFDKSYCDNPTAGFFCDGTEIKKCTDKYDTLCETCNSSSCTKCKREYFLENGVCKRCPGGCFECKNANFCTFCNPTAIADSNGKCTISCASSIANCYTCLSTTNCWQCNSGYYKNSSNKCSKCSDSMPNCISCTGANACTRCQNGYYINKNGSCSKCNISNCVACNSDGNCISCAQGWGVSKDKKSCVQNDRFNCSDSNFIRIDNLCVTKRNMGDSSMLLIPNSVTVVGVSNSCYTYDAACCWSGKTAGNCNSSDGDYSGCNRTVCNWMAANEICSKFTFGGKTWRLATDEELKTWEPLAYGLSTNGLMLCDWSGSYTTQCDANYSGCKSMDRCLPDRVWGTSQDSLSAYIASVGKGIFGVGGARKYEPGSVRCVTEIE